MPIYQYNCPNCGNFDRYLRIDNHINELPCPKCSRESKQVITAPVVHIPATMRWDFEPYESPASGEIITSATQRKKDMANHGCIEWEPGMKQDTERMIKEQDEQLSRDIGETVERKLSEMSGEQLQSLEKLDLSLERLTAGE